MPNAEIIAYVPPRHTRACTHAPPQDSQHVFTHRGPCCSALRGRGAVDMGFPACTAQILPFYSDDARNKAINLTQHHRMEPNCSVTPPWHCCESHGTGLCCTGRAPYRKEDNPPSRPRKRSQKFKAHASGSRELRCECHFGKLGAKSHFLDPMGAKGSKSSAAPDPLQVPQPQGLDIT